MTFQSIVEDVKGRVEPIVIKGQDVVTLSFDTLKQANGIVVGSVQDLFKTEVEAGKDLFAAAKASFEKAKADGIKAVAASPIEYLPEGRERVISAYNDTVSLVGKTSDKLVKVVKSGFDSVSTTLGGKPSTVKGHVTRAKSTAKKTAKKTVRTAKKAAAKATA